MLACIDCRMGLQLIRRIKCSETRVSGGGFVYFLARASRDPPALLHLISLVQYCTTVRCKAMISALSSHPRVTLGLGALMGWAKKFLVGGTGRGVL